MAKEIMFIKNFRSTKKISRIVEKYGKKNGGEGNYIRKLIVKGDDDCKECGGTGYLLDPHSDEDIVCPSCEFRKENNKFIE